jgi:hypothetical protein
MGRLIKFSLFAAIILSPLCAQNTFPIQPLPPAMQSAIDRMIKGTPQPQLMRPVAPTSVCAVPLLEMPMNHPDQFSMRTAPPPVTNDPMPNAHVLPSCDQAASTALTPRPQP